jgi:ribosomal protein S4
MSKRLKNKYKIIKFYKEDLWGKLLINVYKPVKVNKVILQKSVKKFRFKLQVSNIKSRLKSLFKLNERFKPVVKFIGSKYKRKKYNKMLYKRFKKNKNLRYFKYKQVLKDHIKIYKNTRAKPSFNFRTDIGQPLGKFKKLTFYAKKLKNRHKLRKFFSGTISIKQLRYYIKKAHNYVSLSLFFLKLLELRLDAFVYRLNLTQNGPEIRQMINHGNFMVNGKQIFFSNYQLNLFDVFSIKKKKLFFKKLLNIIKKKKLFFNQPKYFEVNFRILSIIYYINPIPEDIFYISKTYPLLLASSNNKFRKK